MVGECEEEGDRKVFDIWTGPSLSGRDKVSGFNYDRKKEHYIIG